MYNRIHSAGTQQQQQTKQKNGYYYHSLVRMERTAVLSLSLSRLFVCCCIQIDIVRLSLSLWSLSLYLDLLYFPSLFWEISVVCMYAMKLRYTISGALSLNTRGRRPLPGDITGRIELAAFKEPRRDERFQLHEGRSPPDANAMHKHTQSGTN